MEPGHHSVFDEIEILAVRGCDEGEMIAGQIRGDKELTTGSRNTCQIEM